MIDNRYFTLIKGLYYRFNINNGLSEKMMGKLVEIYKKYY